MGAGTARPLRLVVGITTYDRPEQYHRTLDALRLASAWCPITVVAVQDGGPTYVKRIEEPRFTVIPRTKENGGKPGYWRTVNACFRQAHAQDPDFYIQLPDDAHYRTDWLKNAVQEMASLGPNSAINLLACHRSEKGMWGILPRPYSAGMMCNGFIDGAFITSREVMNRLGWIIMPINPTRWARHRTLGSGVWSQFTRRMVRRGVNLYMLTDPWLTTDWSGENSKMNPHRRHAIR